MDRWLVETDFIQKFTDTNGLTLVKDSFLIHGKRSKNLRSKLLSVRIKQKVRFFGK